MPFKHKEPAETIAIGECFGLADRAAGGNGLQIADVRSFGPDLSSSFDSITHAVGGKPVSLGLLEIRRRQLIGGNVVGDIALADLVQWIMTPGVGCVGA